MQGLQADLALNQSEPTQLTDWAPHDWLVAADWQETVNDFLSNTAGRHLAQFARQRLQAGATIYPPQPFRALELTPLAAVHVVILGQDPYHGPGQAEGLAFSVARGQRLPPSLRNIFKERQRDLDLPIPSSGSLAGWARQGVLLLNTCLTVEQAQPASHARQGWEALTDALIAAVAGQARPCVYLLWGAHAQVKAGLIQTTAAAHGQEALVLQANHPSPLSASRPPVPFIGCGHLSQTQNWLAQRGVSVLF